jgi:hypothetical protein
VSRFCQAADAGSYLAKARASRDRACAWLLAHIASDGMPVGADKRNGWGRLPWALAVCGEHAAGHRVLSWAERTQLVSGGGFLPGVPFGTGSFGAYPLAHLAIGAWLLERFDVAQGAMTALQRWQDPATGGISMAPPGAPGSDVSDLLSTAQVGQAAVITGQHGMADEVYRWLRDLWRLQPADADGRFFTFRRREELVRDAEGTMKWLSVTDFSKPRQTYYTPGMAAVFLSGYARSRNEPDAVTLAARMLRFNVEGCDEQFTDLTSVQACKFGWGAAAMMGAGQADVWRAHVERMVDWFVARQADDGSWAPSQFLVAEPTDVDRLVKTAEHVMEVNALLAALGGAQG